MTDTAITRYRQLLRALIAQASEPESALLLLCATSLARYWELLHPKTTIHRGTLQVPGTVVNGRHMPARQILLPATLTAGIRDVRGTVYDLLGLPPNRFGALVHRHRSAAAELEVSFPLRLEQLFVVHLDALVAAAATEEQIQAILLSAGIPRNTKREHTLRAGGLGAEFAWIAETTDRFLIGDVQLLARAT